MRFLKYKDLLLADVLTLMLLINVVLVPDFYLRIVVGIIFVLFLPGYLLVSALFPRRMGLEQLERIALSIGLSLAVVPLIGLALNYTPWGIRLHPVLLSLSAFNVLMSTLAYVRRERLPTGEAFNPPLYFNYFRGKWHGLSGHDKLLTVGFFMGLAALGGLAAHFASIPIIGERFTEFYLLGPNGKIADYPTNMTVGETRTLIIGVVNREYETINYTVEVRMENETITTINGITLAHGEKWEQNYTLIPHKVGDGMKLEFLLYTQGNPEPYNELHIWISVEPKEE